MRLRPADATPLATRLAMELWPMPDGRELDAPQARLLEAVRWTPSSPREAERGDFTLERFWMHLTGLLSGISSVRRGNAGPREQREYTTWTPDEIARAVQAARGQLVYLPLMLAGWCGLRRGEVCGLRWDDIDFKAGAVSVCRSLEQAGSVLHVAPPKTASGARTVPMPDALVDALKAHHALYAGLRVRHGGGWNPEGYIMATGRGTPVKPSNLSSAWADFCTRKGLGHLRYHDLRHSFATDMILRQHVDVNIVSELLGHADPAITTTLYVHADDRMHKRAGMRQNKRVTAALAKAEQDSRLVRDNVKQLRKDVG